MHSFNSYDFDGNAKPQKAGFKKSDKCTFTYYFSE